MILPLFTVLIFISLVMVVIGLVKPSESAQALIGFFFLFLLSFTLINGELQTETGAQLNTSMGYNVNGTLTSTSQTVTYQYTNFNNTVSTRLGIYLAIASAVGFAGVMYGLRSSKKQEDD